METMGIVTEQDRHVEEIPLNLVGLLHIVQEGSVQELLVGEFILTRVLYRVRVKFETRTMETHLNTDVRPKTAVAVLITDAESAAHFTGRHHACGV